MMRCNIHLDRSASADHLHLLSKWYLEHFLVLIVGKTMEAMPISRDPLEIIAERGRVLLKGNDGITLAMTPAAANETADRLKAAAFSAARESKRFG